MLYRIYINCSVYMQAIIRKTIMLVTHTVHIRSIVNS